MKFLQLSPTKWTINTENNQGSRGPNLLTEVPIHFIEEYFFSNFI